MGVPHGAVEEHKMKNTAKNKMVKVMGYEVREGSKKWAALVQQKRIWDDMARHEVNAKQVEQ